MKVHTKKEKMIGIVGALMIYAFMFAVHYYIFPDKLRTEEQMEAHALKMADQEAEKYFNEHDEYSR